MSQDISFNLSNGDYTITAGISSSSDNGSSSSKKKVTPTPTLTATPQNTPLATVTISTTTHQPVTQSSAVPGDTKILLNSFNEYLAANSQETGKKLDLSAKQVIYFEVQNASGTEKHSATIDEVGPDYVVITFASTPQQIKFNVGETKKIDVNSDGANEIEATLNSINAGKANVTYKQLMVQKTSIPVANANINPGQKSNSWLWWAGSVIILLLLLFLIFKHRLVKNNNF